MTGTMGNIVMSANWSVCNEEFTTSYLQLAIRDGLPKVMRDELDDHPEEYCSLTYEYWCDLLSTIEVKYERKREAGHIKKIASDREASLSDSDKSVRVPRRNKSKTGVPNSHKPPRRAHDRHHGEHSYCVLFKKSGIPESKYMSHSTKYCTHMRTKRYIKDGLGGPIGSMTHAVQQHNKSKKMEERAEIP